METKGLSFSAIKTWEQCQYKWMRTYDGSIDGKIEKAHSATAIEGSLVHDTLEIWHLDRKQDWRKILKTVALEKKDSFSEGDIKAYGAILHSQYMGAYGLLKAYMDRSDIYPKVIKTEIPFELELPNGVPVRGRIDRVDDSGDSAINLVDYKTTRTMMFRDEVQQSLQGMMYVLVSKYFLFPGKNYTFTIDALRFKPIVVSFDETQLAAALDYIEVIYSSILSTKPEEAKPRLNQFCAYCSVRDTCPLYQTILQNGFKSAFDFEGASMALKPEDHAKTYLEFTEMESAARKVKTRSEAALDKILLETSSRSATFGEFNVRYGTTSYGNPKLIVERINETKNIGNE